VIALYLNMFVLVVLGVFAVLGIQAARKFHGGPATMAKARAAGA
jgi:hypothetical protein